MGIKHKIDPSTVTPIVLFVVVVAGLVLNVRMGDNPTLFQVLVGKVKASRAVSSEALSEHEAMAFLKESQFPGALVRDYLLSDGHYQPDKSLFPVSSGGTVLVEVARVPYARKNKLMDRAAQATLLPSSPDQDFVERVGYVMFLDEAGHHFVAGNVHMRELGDEVLHQVIDLGTITIEGNVHTPAPGVNSYYEKDFKKERRHVRVYVVSEAEMDALEDIRGFCRTRECDLSAIQESESSFP